MGPWTNLVRAVVAALLTLAFALPSASAAPARGPLPTSAPASVGVNSCAGTGACSGATGNIGDNSCNGFAACASSTVNVGDNSCNGDSACYENGGSIGSNSCNGSGGCYFNHTVTIGDYACNADYGFSGCTSSSGNCQGNAVTPTPCLPCSIGSWSSNGIGYPDTCAPADAGHFVDTPGATSQSACVPGYYQPNTGQAQCLPADLNYYVDHSAATSEAPCPPYATTSAIASDSASDCVATSPYALKQAAVTELQALLPTGRSAADRLLNRAIANINKSLVSWRWIGSDALQPASGFRVFKFEKRAVTALWQRPILSRAQLSAVANDAVNRLVAADRELVVNAIAQSSDPTAIANANAKLAQADALIAANLRGPAIGRLRAAWLAVD